MKTGSILVFVILFLTLATGVGAASFTSTSDPTGTNAGQTTQLVNFSVQNTGSVNITQLNITLPNGFVFTGASGTTSPGPYTASTSAPSWTNTSSIGIIGNGATQYFWIYLNTPSATGSYSFNITTLDASAVFTSSNVTFSLFDTLAPTYSSNTTSPSTNSTYSSNQSYWVNITWNDGVGVSKVLIEHNFTGSSTIHNETMYNSSSIYFWNLTDLSAGIHVWKVYANDTNNTFNSTPQFTYQIRQASNIIDVYLNNTRNSNITSINNSAVNITTNASCTQPACTITIVRDSSTTLVSGGSNPYSTNNIITSIGSHNYTVSVAGNTNYTSNSSTYSVATVPSYTTSTPNMPLTFSNTTVGSINITFDSSALLSTISVQGDWSGTTTNYTMLNASGMQYYYNITFPAGTFIWKIYGNYSNHTFNLTAPNTFTINKAAPTLLLNITPQWTLDSPIVTNVSCTLGVAGLTAKLYRNGTAVTNPDVQTFTAGSIYLYFCNNTVNQNYTAATSTNYLIIKPKPSTNLVFTQAPTLIEVSQNTTVTSEIKVKNTGNVAQNVTLYVSDVDKDWYSMDKTTINIFAGSTATFTLTFKGGNFDVKDYASKFTANSSNSTMSQDFTLRILPSDETKVKINDTIALYKLNMDKLENSLVELKTKLNDTTLVEQKLNELNSTLKQAEDYVNSNNYFQAQQTLTTAKALISEIANLLKVEEIGGAVKVPFNVWLIVIGATVVVVVGFATYLFWPVAKGYKPATGQYAYGKEKGKRGLIEMFKSILSKFKRKKTEAVLVES